MSTKSSLWLCSENDKQLSSIGRVGRHSCLSGIGGLASSASEFSVIGKVRQSVIWGDCYDMPPVERISVISKIG